MSTWSVLWSHCLQKGQEISGNSVFLGVYWANCPEIMPAINHNNKCALDVRFCMLPCVFKEASSVQVTSTCDFCVQLVAANQRQRDTVLISTSRTRATNSHVAWISMNQSALPVFYWEQRTSALACKHHIRCRLSPHIQQAKKVAKTSRHEGEQMWTEVCFCFLHRPNIYFPNFPLRKSAATMMDLLKQFQKWFQYIKVLTEN